MANSVSIARHTMRMTPRRSFARDCRVRYMIASLLSPRRLVSFFPLPGFRERGEKEADTPESSGRTKRAPLRVLDDGYLTGPFRLVVPDSDGDLDGHDPQVVLRGAGRAARQVSRVVDVHRVYRVVAPRGGQARGDGVCVQVLE